MRCLKCEYSRYRCQLVKWISFSQSCKFHTDLLLFHAATTVLNPLCLSYIDARYLAVLETRSLVGRNFWRETVSTFLIGRPNLRVTPKRDLFNPVAGYIRNHHAFGRHLPVGCHTVNIGLCFSTFKLRRLLLLLCIEYFSMFLTNINANMMHFSFHFTFCKDKQCPNSYIVI